LVLLEGHAFGRFIDLDACPTVYDITDLEVRVYREWIAGGANAAIQQAVIGPAAA
jgi:hypothetical protein